MQVQDDKIIHQLIKEIKIQNYIDHCNVVKLYTVFHDEDNIYLLLEFCNEGNLYELMRKKIKIAE